MRTKFTFLFLFLLVMAAVTMAGQESGQKPTETKPSETKPSETKASLDKSAKFDPIRDRLKESFPFQGGEQLVYEMRLSRFPIYGTIGTLTFTLDEQLGPLKPEAETIQPVAEKLQTENGEQAKAAQPAEWQITVAAHSKGILTSLFRIKVEDIFTSTVSARDFGVIKTVKKIEEGKRRREMIADFQRQARKVKYTHTDLNNSKLLVIKENDTLPWVTDIASGWYVMRAQQLTVGKTFSFPLSDEGETYEIEVEVLEKERIDTDFGKFDTLKLDMKIFNGRYIRRKGRLLLWVTDDERHLPLRAQIKSNFGTVNASLIDFKNVKGMKNTTGKSTGQ